MGVVWKSNYDPGWDYPSSTVWASTAAVVEPLRGMMPQSPRKHIMKCRSCGRSSMIPDSTDKIMALVCPQCGGALDD